VRDRRASVDVTSALGGAGRDPQVDTERAIRLDQRWWFDVAGSNHGPRAANQYQIARTTLVFEHRALPRTAHAWDRRSPSEGPDRDQRIGERTRAEAISGGTAGERANRAFRFLVACVGIASVGERTNTPLRRQATRCSTILITPCVERERAERACVPRHVTAGVARGSGRQGVCVRVSAWSGVGCRFNGAISFIE